MAEYDRVVTFEADDAAINEMVSMIKSSDSPPEGVAATRITVLADRADGKVVVAVRFGSEEDLRERGRGLRGHEPAGLQQYSTRLRRCVRGLARTGRSVALALESGLRGEPAGSDCSGEALEVALVLIGVRRGEVGKRPSNASPLPEVRRDRDPVAPARVGAGKRRSTERGVERRARHRAALSTSTPPFQSWSWRT